MFLHIGSGRSVPVKDIAIILDYETSGGEARPLIAKKYVDAGGGRKSAVITADAVYYSPIVKETLRKRLQQMIEFRV